LDGEMSTSGGRYVCPDARFNNRGYGSQILLTHQNHRISLDADGRPFFQ